MEDENDKLKRESKEKIFQIFRDILARVAELEELGAVGNRLLIGFHQGLEFLRRPPINKTSKLIGSIIEANKSKMFASYLEAGCMNSHDVVENTSKLHTCLVGLHDHLIKAKSILDDIKCHLEDANDALQTANKCSSAFLDNADKLDQLEETNSEEDVPSSHLEEPQMTDYAALIAMIYSMVKQDYVMQEKIVTSLSLKSSQGELECYCLMWSLRPFINDQIMRQAWSLVT
ncbi:hypothetical protein SLA2020_404010 [Shorea laevis]